MEISINSFLCIQSWMPLYAASERPSDSGYKLALAAGGCGSSIQNSADLPG